MARKTEKNRIKYDMPLKARIILESMVAVTMLLAPFAWAFTVVVVAVKGLWGAFIDMPLEVRQRIMVEYIQRGIAIRKKPDLTEV